MRKILMIFAATAAMASTAASAQPDYSLRPSFGTINLTAGFVPDPRVINVTAGGRLDAATLGPGCLGSVANSPDVRLNYTAGTGLPLIISVASADDTTLVINGPDGRWYCDDDGGEQGLNPSLSFANPASGQYDIYIGHYAQGRSIPARLYISELTSQ
ncbi:MAG: hypothetical protein AB7O91_02970 [Sphingomonas sp.]